MTWEHQNKMDPHRYSIGSYCKISFFSLSWALPRPVVFSTVSRKIIPGSVFFVLRVA